MEISGINKNKVYLDGYSIILAAILLLAFALRIWGINFGLPNIYHTDEWFEVKRALKLGAGVIDFERVNKGGYFYLLFVEYGIYYLILKFFGFVSSAESFLTNIFKNPSAIWLIGRITTAVIGSINCYLVYLAGKFAFSKNVGIFAGLYLALNLIHVESSQIIAVDVPLTALITLCLVLIFRDNAGSQSKCSASYYALIGAVFALAVMTKITGAVVLFPALLFHFKNLKDEKGRVRLKDYFNDLRLYVFVGIAIIVYIVGNPGVVYKIKSQFLWMLSFFNVGSGVEKVPEFPLVNKQTSLLKYYAGVLFPLKYFGLALFIWAGAVLGFKWRLFNTVILMSLVVPLIFFLGTSHSIEHVYPRYLLPLTPVLAIFFGVSCQILIKYVQKNIFRAIFLGFLLVLFLFPAIRDIVIFDTNLTKPDTRTIADKWFYDTVNASDTIILEGSYYKASPVTVPLKMKPEVLDEITSYDDIKDASDKRGMFYRALRKSLMTGKGYNLVLIYNERQLRNSLTEKKGDYIVLRESLINACHLDHNIKAFPDVCRLVSWAESQDFKMIKKFEKNEIITGPTMLVFQRRYNPDL